MIKWLLKMLGIRPEVVPVLVERGHVRGVMTHEEQTAMRRRWAEMLQGRAEDPRVKSLVELIEWRSMRAMAQVQYIQNHAGNGHVVSYRAGEAAALNDLLADVVRCLKGEVPGGAE
jgi:hypothetical protein